MLTLVGKRETMNLLSPKWSMNITEDSKVTAQQAADLSKPAASGRRADVDAKHAAMLKLLEEMGCEGLLIMQPGNFAWLTSGGTSGGTLHQANHPCLYYQGDYRFLLSGNADTQRLFDEEIDGLGFQVKEWSWQLGREDLLTGLCQGREIACDWPFGSCKPVGDKLQKLRWRLTEYERSCYQALGQIVGHALEATGRTMAKGEPEREVAGQIAHRLLHRGALPMNISVAGDGRRKYYRQPSFTAAPVRENCTLAVVARKFGLCAQASRSISFGQPDAQFRKDHDAACKVCATYIAGTWPESVPRQILLGGRRIYQLLGIEHEWMLCPQGHVIGWSPLEMELTPQNEDLLDNHSAICWQVSIGSAISCDTFLIAEEGPMLVTPIENWPVKRIRIQGAEFLRPDVLVR